MTMSLRPATLFLAAVAAVSSTIPPARPDDREEAFTNRIKAAVDYIEERNWAVIIPHLQKLVDIKEDVFVQMPPRPPDCKETPRRVSVRAEANRLIGALPPEGLEFYKLTFGPQALALLQEAKGDPARLERLARRFPHTDAGKTAIALLTLYRWNLR